MSPGRTCLSPLAVPACSPAGKAAAELNELSSPHQDLQSCSHSTWGLWGTLWFLAPWKTSEVPSETAQMCQPWLAMAGKGHLFNITLSSAHPDHSCPGFGHGLLREIFQSSSWAFRNWAQQRYLSGFSLSYRDKAKPGENLE